MDYNSLKDLLGEVKKIYSYCGHTGLDEGGFINHKKKTPRIVCDNQDRDTLMLGDESELCANAAYSSV